MDIYLMRAQTLFPVAAGVLQGDMLAPFLFIIAFDFAMRTPIDNNEKLRFTLEEGGSKRKPPKINTDTDLADDIALIANTMRDANQRLRRVEEAAQQIGLHISQDKIEYICIYEKGKIFKQVEDF